MADKPTFSDILTALVTSTVSARQSADLSTLYVANIYRRNEYLRELPVPRMRYDNVKLDVPILLEGVLPAVALTLASARSIADHARDSLERAIESRDLGLAPADLFKLYEQFHAGYEKLDLANRERLISRFAHAPDLLVADALAELAEGVLRDLFAPWTAGKSKEYEDKVTQVIADVRFEIEFRAIEIPSRAPQFTVSAQTEAVKNAGTPQSAARIEMSLREEGLLWNYEPEGRRKGWMLVPE
jgi:hypothetical protein